MVGRVHQRVEQIRHGIPPEPSRTSLEDSGMCLFEITGSDGPVFTRRLLIIIDCTDSIGKFVRYFKEEIKDQMKGKPPNKL